MTWWGFFLTAYVVGKWVIRVVMIPIVVRRRSLTGALGWLCVILTLPWIGLLLYLLIGENPLARRRIKRRGMLEERFPAVDEQAQHERYEVRPLIPHDGTHLAEVANRLGYMPMVGGNQARLMSRTDEVIERLIADIDAAEHHVHLLFYIFLDDQTGRRVGDALARASGRGVRCRVIADAVGSRPMFKRLGPWLRGQGVEVLPALPVNILRRRAARIDVRNHRKLAVIDGRIGYTGSQNIVNPNYGHKDLVWHDLTVRVIGPTVLQLQLIFMEDWHNETQQVLEDVQLFPTPDTSGELVIQTVPTGPTYWSEALRLLIASAIHTARRRVIITSPYLVPNEALIQAFSLAVLRGVRVDMVVPRKTDRRLADFASRAYYDNLLDAGVRLHLYQAGLLHAKTMTVDDSFAMIGSANFDIRSFLLNFELNLLFYGARIAGELRAQQERYIQASLSLHEAQWDRRPGSRRLLEDGAKLLSPLL